MTDLKVLFVSQAPRAAFDLVLVAKHLCRLLVEVEIEYFDLQSSLDPQVPSEQSDILKATGKIIWSVQGQAGEGERWWSDFKRTLGLRNYDLIILPMDLPGVFQKIIACCQERGSAVAILNETPLSVVHTGTEPYVIGHQTTPFFGPSSASINGWDHLRHFKNHWLGALRQKKPVSPPKWDYRGHSQADFMGVSGALDEQLLAFDGVRSDRVERVGWPRAERLLSQPLLAKEKLLEALQVPPKDSFIVLSLQKFQKAQTPLRRPLLECLKRFCELTREHFPSYQVLISLHPDQDKNLMQSQLGRFGDNMMLIQNYPHTKSLYSHASLTVGFFSTSLIEAMLCGSLVMTLDYALMQTWYPFLIESGAVCPVLSESSLLGQLKRVIGDTNYQKRLHENQKDLLDKLVGSSPHQGALQAAHWLHTILEKMKTSSIVSTNNATAGNFKPAKEIGL